MLEGMLKPGRTMVQEHAKKSPRKQVEKTLPVATKECLLAYPEQPKTSIAKLRCTCCVLLRAS